MIDEDDPQNEFPEDELDYYFQLLQEFHNVGHQMITSTDSQEVEKLTKRYAQLQKWLDELYPNNAWEE